VHGERFEGTSNGKEAGENVSSDEPCCGQPKSAPGSFTKALPPSCHEGKEKSIRKTEKGGKKKRNEEKALVKGALTAAGAHHAE